MPEPVKPMEGSKEDADLKTNETSGRADIEAFEWLQYQDPGEERNKFTKALLQNPLVPIGACATVLALVCGIYQMKQNNSAKQQFFMRARVGAQGFTIAALLGGLFYESHLKETTNKDKLKQ